MSYDIDLCDPVTKKVIVFDFKHQIRGGTYPLGGNDKAHLNITYNYGDFFHEKIDKQKGIRSIYGKTGSETIPILKKAIDDLEDDVDDDYWKPTEGNAKQALNGLLALAQLRPDGVWEGD